jgi:1,4-alpha-glucan branching enzyme
MLYNAPLLETKLQELITRDPHLLHYREKLLSRYQQTNNLFEKLVYNKSFFGDSSNIKSNTLDAFATGYTYYGLHREGQEWVFREWAPHATAIVLFGEMTGWEERSEFHLKRINSQGTWELRVPESTFQHEQQYRLKVYWSNGQGERVPVWTIRAVQDPLTQSFNAQVWAPEHTYKWRIDVFQPSQEPPLIYEAHVGMAQDEPRVGSYKEFTYNMLPRIKNAGYNTIQLMAIQEHPYYGSFGYQVSSYFAPSSRFGTPEDLKNLIDTAHEMEIAVIMDIVHSHAVSNEVEGIGKFDGTDYQYFHTGSRGTHPAWDSRCFDYSKLEVVHFLLSNCRYWLKEFKFDGFRFDGVTSMLYIDHGLEKVFTCYDQYFNDGVDQDALSYLMLACKLSKEINPNIALIAEDVSGMPGLALDQNEGGIGFDYRFAMGIPDHWIKMVKDQLDEEWNMGWLWHELTNRRADERTISYAESHDQALVGDQSLFFRLVGPDIYWHMSITDQSLTVDRGVALHKMIRLITIATAGHGYMNFMGNEFGHPEWIDFPRAGNNWSYQHARRQFNLSTDLNLRFSQLNTFDKEMILFFREHSILCHEQIYLRHEHEADKILAFERNGLLFIFNFHSQNSYTDYPINAYAEAYTHAFDSDSTRFGGFNRIASEQEFITFNEKNQRNHVKLYIPARTALILKSRSND